MSTYTNTHHLILSPHDSYASTHVTRSQREYIFSAGGQTAYKSNEVTCAVYVIEHIITHAPMNLVDMCNYSCTLECNGYVRMHGHMMNGIFTDYDLVHQIHTLIKVL